MPIFEYKAYAKGGATTKGVIDADTPRAARQELRRQNILVSELKEIRGKGKRAKKKAQKDGKKPGVFSKLGEMRQSKSGPSGRDLDIVTAITRQMATLLAAGIPMAEALNAIIDQADSRRIETMFREVRERITQGSNFGDALSDYPSLFSDLYVNMVRAGEATGQLDIVLSRLADFMQRQRQLQRKVVSAMAYPMMMVGIGILVVALLMTIVVPKITGMLQDTGQEMPAPTKVLIGISDFFKSYWWAVCLVIAALSYAVERIYRTKRGRLVIDRNLLKIPVIGELLRKSAVSRFTRTLATLLSSGVAAVRSLEIVETVVGNRVIADATGHIRERILEGTDISTPLKATGAFPSVVGYMVSIGEQSGELENMLDRIAEAYDEEIEVVTERATTILEPLMIVILAVVVGFIVWAIVLPILQVGSIG